MFLGVEREGPQRMEGNHMPQAGDRPRLPYPADARITRWPCLVNGAQSTRAWHFDHTIIGRRAECLLILIVIGCPAQHRLVVAAQKLDPRPIGGQSARRAPIAPRASDVLTLLDSSLRTVQVDARQLQQDVRVEKRKLLRGLGSRAATSRASSSIPWASSRRFHSTVDLAQPHRRVRRLQRGLRS